MFEEELKRHNSIEALYKLSKLTEKGLVERRSNRPQSASSKRCTSKAIRNHKKEGIHAYEEGQIQEKNQSIKADKRINESKQKRLRPKSAKSRTQTQNITKDLKPKTRLPAFVSPYEQPLCSHEQTKNHVNQSSSMTNKLDSKKNPQILSKKWMETVNEVTNNRLMVQNHLLRRQKLTEIELKWYNYIQEKHGLHSIAKNNNFKSSHKNHDTINTSSNTLRQEEYEGIMDLIILEKYTNRLETLWEELRIPERDCKYFKNRFLNTLTEKNHIQIEEQIQILLKHRKATIHVCQIISKREEEIIRFQTYLDDLEMDDDKSIPQEMETIIYEHLYKCQERTMAVIQAILEWRQNLWRPKPFFWKCMSYFEKVQNDFKTIFSFIHSTSLFSKLKWIDVMLLCDMKTWKEWKQDDDEIEKEDQELENQWKIKNLDHGSPRLSFTINSTNDMDQDLYKNQIYEFILSQTFHPSTCSPSKERHLQLYATHRFLKLESPIQEELKQEEENLSSRGMYIPTLRWNISKT